jgi:uncharacterized protein (TIGR02391 family)
MEKMNYKLIAIQIGDVLKYDASVKDIGRAAKSIFTFQKEVFPEESSISSERAKLIYDWILTLAKQSMNNDDRNLQLHEFISLITPASNKDKVEDILGKGGVIFTEDNDNKEFINRGFHEQIHLHCKKLFNQKNYFHAVFEAAKVYNKLVQEKSQSSKDGFQLMMDAWALNGTLKLTAGITETDKNIQEGNKFLSAGLMQAMRNPTAHEPALDWTISKTDCLDMLSFISYLFRQLDKSVYYNK